MQDVYTSSGMPSIALRAFCVLMDAEQTFNQRDNIARQTSEHYVRAFPPCRNWHASAFFEMDRRGLASRLCSAAGTRILAGNLWPAMGSCIRTAHSPGFDPQTCWSEVRSCDSPNDVYGVPTGFRLIMRPLGRQVWVGRSADASGDLGRDTGGRRSPYLWLRLDLAGAGVLGRHGRGWLAWVVVAPLRQGFGGHIFARGVALENMAERQGFEPWLRLPVKRLSS